MGSSEKKSDRESRNPDRCWKYQTMGVAGLVVSNSDGRARKYAVFSVIQVDGCLCDVDYRVFLYRMHRVFLFFGYFSSVGMGIVKGRWEGGSVDV